MEVEFETKVLAKLYAKICDANFISNIQKELENDFLYKIYSGYYITSIKYLDNIELPLLDTSISNIEGLYRMYYPVKMKGIKIALNDIIEGKLFIDDKYVMCENNYIKCEINRLSDYKIKIDFNNKYLENDNGVIIKDKCKCKILEIIAKDFESFFLVKGELQDN